MPTQRDRIELQESQAAVDSVRKMIRNTARAHGDPSTLYRIELAATLRDAAEAVLQSEIAVGTEMEGLSWREVGEALGVSAQAAHRRYR